MSFDKSLERSAKASVAAAIHEGELKEQAEDTVWVERLKRQVKHACMFDIRDLHDPTTGDILPMKLRFLHGVEVKAVERRLPLSYRTRLARSRICTGSWTAIRSCGGSHSHGETQ